MGVVHTKNLDYEIHKCEAQGSYRKMVFSPDGSHLTGMVLMGDISNAGLYRHVIQEKMHVEKFKRQIINHCLHWGHFIK